MPIKLRRSSSRAVRKPQRGYFQMRLPAIRKPCTSRRTIFQAEIAVVQAYRGVHNFDEAKKILDEAHREHPAALRRSPSTATWTFSCQTYEAAIAHLNAALALDPADVDARNRARRRLQSQR